MPVAGMQRGSDKLGQMSTATVAQGSGLPFTVRRASNMFTYSVSKIRVSRQLCQALRGL